MPREAGFQLRGYDPADVVQEDLVGQPLEPLSTLLFVRLQLVELCPQAALKLELHAGRAVRRFQPQGVPALKFPRPCRRLEEEVLRREMCPQQTSHRVEHQLLELLGDADECPVRDVCSEGPAEREHLLPCPSVKTCDIQVPTWRLPKPCVFFETL